MESPRPNDVRGPIPSYSELAAGDGRRPAGSTWGVFGDEDELGTVNLMTSTSVRHGIEHATAGEVYPLNWPIDEPQAHPSRPAPRRTHLIAAGGVARDDLLEPFHLQYSTQWDGLRHFRRAEGFYNGVAAHAVDDPASSVLGIHRWARSGIVGRGVLLDVAARFASGDGAADAPGDLGPITAAMLDDVAARQGVSVSPGDVLVVRTGWMAWYASLAPGERTTAFAAPESGRGLEPSDAVVEWLWDRGVMAVVADNPGVEPLPMSLDDDSSLHARLIAGLGMPLGELFWLEDLASACQRDRRWTFLFVSAPLHVIGGVGSPGNAIAIR